MPKRLNNEHLPQKIRSIKEQRSYVMIKPDGVMRGIIGDVLSRIERTGLRIVAMKMISPSKEQIIAHYPMDDQAWVDRLGKKGYDTFIGAGLDVVEFLGTESH